MRAEYDNILSEYDLTSIQSRGQAEIFTSYLFASEDSLNDGYGVIPIENTPHDLAFTGLVNNPKNDTDDFGDWTLLAPFYLNAKSWDITATGTFRGINMNITHTINVGQYYSKIIDNEGEETIVEDERFGGNTVRNGNNWTFLFSQNDELDDETQSLIELRIDFVRPSLIQDENSNRYILLPGVLGYAIVGKVNEDDPPSTTYMASVRFDFQNETYDRPEEGDTISMAWLQIPKSLNYDVFSRMGVIQSLAIEELDLTLTITPSETYAPG